MIHDSPSAAAALIFIVEDEPDIASLIALTLNKAGFTTRIFADGQAVVQTALEQQPALILLDGMLPHADGLDILRSLEKQERARRIRKIMLSARGSEADKVRALELGADDYLTKPFSPRELTARVHAVLRSAKTMRAEKRRILQMGMLVVDLDAMAVTVDGRDVTFTTTEFNLLLYFMRHPGYVLSRDQLLSNAWPANCGIEDRRVVDVYVRRLREKIEADPSNPALLVTRRGDGYSFIDATPRELSAD